MTILIIAGGQNSRFFPLNSHTHKGFITLCGKPLIIWQLENLSQHGFTDIVIVVSPKDHQPNHLNRLLKQHQLEHLNPKLVEQPKPKGMGNAVLLAQSLLADQFAVMAPYHLTAGTILTQIVGTGTDSTASSACVTATETKEPWLYGMLKRNDNQATGIVEKPEPGQEPSDLKVQSLYLLNQHFIQLLTQTPPAEYNFETALNQLMQQSTVGIHKLESALPSLKYPWHLFALRDQIFSTLTPHLSPLANIAPTAILDDSSGPIVIEDGATIGHAARIVGPSYIGQDCLVGDFSLVRNTSMEQGSKIGVHADITRSIFLPGSTFHGGGFIGDSIIGPDVKIGAGFITANKRFDRQSIKTKVKGETVDTCLTALGTIIGQDSKIGIRAATMPGVLIGSQTVIEPGTIINKNINHSQT